MSLVLAIESSCDETAAAIVDDQMWVHSSVVASQIELHARFGGVVPELASRNHLAAVGGVVRRALAQARIGRRALDAVCVTSGPGLAGCLLVGLQFAKALAYTLGRPLVPVDHILAHVHAVFLRDAGGAGEEVPAFPYVALAVSGGHTSLCRIDAPGRSTTLGQTLDDAAGEAFDKVAKMMGLGYPGGVEIDRLARGGARDAVDLPRPMLKRGLDFSFSGLKTAVRYHLQATEAVATEDARAKADLAASAQEAIVDVLVAKSLAACAREGIDRLVVAGGVACNSRLRERFVGAAARAEVTLFLTPPRFCTDNAAMVGGLGQSLRTDGALTGRALTDLDIYTTRRPPL